MKVVILFDGVCNLCNGIVQFLIKRDQHDHFRFAPLQSDAGERLLNEQGINIPPESMVVISNGEVYTESSAALIIAKHMSSFWKLAYGFVIIPRPIRNRLYQIIARNRLKLFGQRQECMMPTPELKKKFLSN
ncbi:thiol-disulfide oxidoreductase DCC family protein [Alkalibacillus aidingensis]|uniref:thiol-disulfide oxidoreductase DCC family protein n=1 Tax=Alkalibacillus aidingensis TaxID=2747607 RepID=UPI001660FAF4|nr:DCC1-like thiol-disulfide oxidoreductase family protein [Alkalibacillus aidingensis]